MSTKRRQVFGMTRWQVVIVITLAFFTLGSIIILVVFSFLYQVPNTQNVLPINSITQPSLISTPITQTDSVFHPRDSDAYHISGESWFRCSDRDYYHNLVEYIADQDVQALEQALTNGILYGECTLFDNGEQVYLTETAIFSGLVKIRRQGETQEFWTFAEAEESNH